jgi:hypothetical protein
MPMETLRLPRRRQRSARQRRLGDRNHVAFVRRQHLGEGGLNHIMVLGRERKKHHAATPTAGTR